ncbi:MAG: Nif11-like leader peptide family natural product precursor [Sneathiellaceae bacterium]
MSQTDVRRFFVTLQQDSGLAAEVKSQSSFEAVLALARGRGYDITPACVIGYLCRLTVGDKVEQDLSADAGLAYFH